MSHPVQELDDVVHQRNRLGILTVIREGTRAEFGFLRETLGMTDGNLSRHLKVLEAAGFVRLEKGFVGRRPRTWVRITRAGRRALSNELRRLRELLQQIGEAEPNA